MNEEEFKKICVVCDEILLSPRANLVTVCIPWLHVLNEHPSNLKKYTELFDHENENTNPEFTHFIVESIRDWYGIMRSKRIRFGKRTQKSVIFISHLLNEKQAVSNTDFYFGDLPADLNKENITNLLVLLNHTGVNSEKLGGITDQLMNEKAFFPSRLSFFTELKIRIRLLLESYRLCKTAKKETGEFKKRVLFKAASEALSTSSVFVLRLFYYIAALVKDTKAKSIALTFEGHSWERIAFAAAKSADPDVCCIGYHHTILFPLQHAVMRMLPEKFQPDIILTAGDHTKEHFRAAYPYSVKVETLGMHRFSKNDFIERTVSDNMNKPTCLVIPDGIISEIQYMFHFVLAAAKAAPEVHFLLRMHPVVPVESFIKQNEEFKDLPANVSFSDKDIQSDFIRSQWALYRGSNSAIYATIAGLRPVYLARTNELAIDCLYECKSWKKTVSEVEALIAILRADLDQKDKTKLSAESEEAVNSAKTYFMPVNNNVFLDAISGSLY